jgi:hypothetical protein
MLSLELYSNLAGLLLGSIFLIILTALMYRAVRKVKGRRDHLSNDPLIHGGVQSTNGIGLLLGVYTPFAAEPGLFLAITAWWLIVAAIMTTAFLLEGEKIRPLKG